LRDAVEVIGARMAALIAGSVDLVKEAEEAKKAKGGEPTQAILKALERLAQTIGSVSPLRIEVLKAPSLHIGLGSKTTLVLAALTAANIELGLNLSREELQRLSGRGGTSGIGINTFFHGGLVIDGGHLELGTRKYQPSSSGAPDRVPPIIAAREMPDDWEVTLLLAEGPRRSSGEERAFFAANTPIKNQEVDRVVTLAFMDITTAVIDHDLHSFALAISAMQKVGFKQREVLSSYR
jgi:beta-ribofuranosylaminobenzene 5'-phosphate synthase